MFNFLLFLIKSLLLVFKAYVCCLSIIFILICWNLLIRSLFLNRLILLNFWLIIKKLFIKLLFLDFRFLLNFYFTCLWLWNIYLLIIVAKIIFVCFCFFLLFVIPSWSLLVSLSFLFILFFILLFILFFILLFILLFLVLIITKNLWGRFIRYFFVLNMITWLFVTISICLNSLPHLIKLRNIIICLFFIAFLKIIGYFCLLILKLINL